ncbi:YciI family protein [Catelliglobosispora koreensis]|uniref:YciI family protein n=1 Tax=Catelliglobosispora koreensis TaxID=129052 RepID=UPI0003774688
MKYLMQVCTDPGYEVSEADAANIPDIEAWVSEMDSRGVRLMGNRTRPASEATTIRVRGGEVLLTDGPFAETKEQMAGFDILECRDLDEAIEVASKHPMAWAGMIEIRPFWPDDEE